MSTYPICYAAVNKDEDVRKRSSSGGIFYLIAEYVIDNGGVVFGARYDDSWEVIHHYVENMEGIDAFMGSKYVQSSVGNAYKDVLSFLKQGREVLFSGTPCQVYGLKAFLGKEFDNLITVDLICHGVPSRSVWRKYLKLRAKEKDVEKVNFRDKTEGWLDFSLKVDFLDESCYRKNQHKDLFMKGFLQDIYLRPACYECRFKGVRRNSDITLADLWGCKEIVPELFDDKGTSLVLIQSDKGKKIWTKISRNMKVCKIEGDEYQRYNPNLKVSVNMNKKRAKFYKNCSMQNLKRLTFSIDLIGAVLGKVKQVVKKVIKDE